MIKKPIFTYAIRDNLYINLTNQCTLSCTFCPKFKDWIVKDYFLKLDHEPELEEILAEIPEPDDFREIVFCGYGEPTLRLEVLKEIADNLKTRGKPYLRLNTDGLGNLRQDRNICPELATHIDAISVSLNAANRKTYARLCPNPYGEKAYAAVMDFIRKAKEEFQDVTASVVGIPRLELDSCRRIVEKDLGVKFRLRVFNEVG